MIKYVQPFPGPRSVVICDNVALHHAWGGMLRSMIEGQGGRLLYLPTYSPMLNPIEKGFRNVLDHMREHWREVRPRFFPGSPPLSRAADRRSSARTRFSSAPSLP